MTKKIFSIFSAVVLVGAGVGTLVNLPKVEADSVDILPSSWTLAGNNGSTEKYQPVSSNILSGKSTLQITYNLHGTCLLSGDASALIFDQNGWKYVPLSAYGTNCQDGVQTVSIPLSSFKDITNGTQLDTTKPLTGEFHVRLWDDKKYAVDINSVSLIGGTGDTTPPTPPVTPAPTGSLFQGISDGQTVSGVIDVSYNVPASSTKKVDFYIDGGLKSTENYAPYFLGGDNNGVPRGWDTHELTDGTHVLKVVVTNQDGSTASAMLTFTVSNLGDLSTLTPTPTATTVPTNTPTPTSSPTPTATPTPTSNSGSSDWAIQSIDVMKDTKDTICGQKDDTYIKNIVSKAKELGANYVAISTPYDNPSCGDATVYAKRWVDAIRAQGMHVWHRHMPLSFEGIYSVSKNNSSNYLDMISNYIKNNKDLFQDGDIFTPIPEPQNGGINGVTYCANGVCQFQSAASFNQWLRDAMTTSKNAFDSIGLHNVKIGYFGFDGFVAWGDQNPDWHGILEDSTVQQMGNITIDHYPELVNETMDQSLTALQAKYPHTPIVIGEWGTVNNQNIDQEVQDTMSAAKKHGVVGFNYWQFGPSGSGEQLINTDFTDRSSFQKVESFFKAQQ